MATDKYSATWVSHSSISDYLKCPRSYYLKNVYKDPKTGHKIQIMSAPLALGQAVHEVLESLSQIPTEQRFTTPLFPKFEEAWAKVTGKKGGFVSESEEKIYKNRGLEMLKRVIKNPGPLKNLSVKLKGDLPYFWLSDEDEIILCGKIDWLEYLPETDSVHIIDFKTSKKAEDDSSLQLPIYTLLVHHCQKRATTKASYWYLDFSDDLQEKKLPDLEESRATILKIAKQIKLARQLKSFKCVRPGDCMFCAPFEAILRDEAEFVRTDDYNRDVYIFKKPDKFGLEDESIVL